MPSAWSDDEGVEAIELPQRRFALGVRWHPEADVLEPRLFDALVAADRARAGGDGESRSGVGGQGWRVDTGRHAH